MSPSMSPSLNGASIGVRDLRVPVGGKYSTRFQPGRATESRGRLHSENALACQMAVCREGPLRVEHGQTLCRLERRHCERPRPFAHR